jgi:hypothetical protein
MPRFNAVPITPVRQHQHVTRACPGVREHPRRVHQSGYRVAELHLIVRHTVAADECAPRFGNLLRSAAQNGTEIVNVALAWIAENGQRRQRTAAHRVNIAQRIRRGDSAERIRIVHNRREEVERLHESALLRQPVDARIVRGVEADHHVGIAGSRESRKRLVQNLWTEFRRSTRGLDVGCQFACICQPSVYGVTPTLWFRAPGRALLSPPDA